MNKEDETGDHYQSNSESNTIPLRTEEDVAKEFKRWMEFDTDSDEDTKKLYDNAIEHIESNLNRPLSYLELTWTERQYVITLLQLWLKKSLEKTFEYLNDKENDVRKYMSIVLSQLNSINSFEGIRSNQLKDGKSPLFNWCDGNCRYLQLILEQEDLFKNTPRFTAFVNCYLKQFKLSCIEKVFSRCLNDIVTDTTNGEKHRTFIEALNQFLSNANEEKNLKYISDKDEFLIHYVKNENKTGQDIIKQLVEMFSSSSVTEQGGTVIATRPEWLQTFLSYAYSISDDEWTPKLQLLTKETCKRFLLPETEIIFKEKDGKEIISIRGVVIFVSQMIEKMSRLKDTHPDVEEIKIVALKSVHIDCDLDNGIWHGINIRIVTDKLIVDDRVNDGSFCWDVTGEKAKDQLIKGKPGERSESGGNVHIVCNQIINGEKWTIVADGGDGSASYEWTKEEFEKSFPSMSTDDNREAIKTVLTTLQEILPKENRDEGKDISPEHTGNFVVRGRLEDCSEITVIFYKGKKTKQTLISIQGSWGGPGGYGGDIAMECFGIFNNVINLTPGGVPFTGSKNQTPLTAVRYGVYEASGYNFKIGKKAGDVAFIQKNADASSGQFYGFEKYEVIQIALREENVKPDDTYVKYKDAENEKWYAVLKKQSRSKEGTLCSENQRKSVIRQSLVWHLEQINEWNRLTETIQMMLCNLKERHSNSIEEIINEMDNKVRQLHQQLMTQQQRQKHSTLEKVQYVKPAKDSSSHSAEKPEIIGLRPVYYPNKKNEIFNIFCLDVLPTVNGNDSLLHCLFGQVNSNGKYECSNPVKFRKQMANYIREKDNDVGNYYAVIMFVLRVKDDERFPIAKTEGKEFIDFIMKQHPQVKGTETEISRWLNQNDDENEPKEIIELWKSVWKRDYEIIRAELQEIENCRIYRDLKEEYAKYIESFSSHRRTATGLLDLGMLVDMFELKIHVFEEHVSPSSFQHIETHKLDLNDIDSRREEHFILYEGKGRWKKLEPNDNLNRFCKDFFTLEANGNNEKANENKNETCFETLKTWIDENQEITNKNCIDKFNPKYNKTPDKLSRFLLDWLNMPNMDVDETKQLVKAMSLLAKWVDYYNTRNVSPFFYLTIVEKYGPQDWVREFLVLEMETRLSKYKSERSDNENWRISESEISESEMSDEDNIENWRKSVRESLETHDQALLSLLTQIAMKTKKNDILFSFDLEKLLRMLNVAKQLGVVGSFLDKEDVDSFSVINFFYKNRGAFWVKKVDERLKDNQLNEENKSEYVNLLLELEYKNKQKLLQDFTNNSAEAIGYLVRKTGGQKFTREPRTVEEIIIEMKRKDDENQIFKNNIKKMVNQSKSKKIQLENCIESIVKRLIEENEEKYKKYRMFLKEEQRNQTMKKTCDIKNIGELFKNILKKANKSEDAHLRNICSEIKNSIYDRQSGNKMTPENFLCVFDYAVELTMGFELRDTQRVAIMTLLQREDDEDGEDDKINTLAQVKTGEGKSIIVAGLAIGYALKSKHQTHNSVDVITSNDILAIRDSSRSVTEGGLKELYEFFNVTVSNNCSQFADDRKMAYRMIVVYGQLANFQRDYLLDEFYNRNIRDYRRLEIGIIDEADSMLLDRGSNVLYLSHDIPGMETLESLYVFIWEQILQTTHQDNSPEVIKANVLYELYGQITQENLNSIYAPLEQEERLKIWEHLIEKEIIDRQGRLLIHDVSKITEEKINYEPTNETLKEKQLNSKIFFYLRTLIERERLIRIPDHFMNFVDRHLDTWLDNARRALELKQDEDYVIDCDRSDTSPDLNPQVIIIDPETGTDQFNSQWDGALHQFLQLKERCKLTLQSVKAVFISNANYLNKYGYLAGVSGTLGSEQEQEFLRNTYQCDLFTVPTAVPKRFSLKTPKLLKTKESWRNAILEETRQTVDKRSIVIFCQSIKEVNEMYKHLKSAIPVLRDNKRIHRYTRDHEKFEFESKKLNDGHVIVATNLAGRGTDIKLSETLKVNGGLHICLTYFPDNERIEEQAMGRAARKGEPGSGILILCEAQTAEMEESGTSEEWGEEKIFVMKEERAWKERQRISRLEKDFNNIEMLENLSKKSTKLIFKNSIEINFHAIEVKNEIIQLIQQLNDDELFTVIHDNLLDKWAMWLDETDFNFKCYNIKQHQIGIGLKKSIIDIPKCMTLARKVTFAKHLAMEKSKIKWNEIKKRKEKAKAKDKAIDILKSVIRSPDHFFYPTAFYNHAFILLRKSGFDKKELILTLRSAENILNEHVAMQISFIQIHQSERKPASSFYTVDGYEEQKKNTIKILKCFISSIQSLLGNHYLSASDIQEKLALLEHKKEDAQKGRESVKTDRLQRADQLFKWLMECKYIECEVNDPDTVPNYSDVIRKIANKYDVKRSFLEDKMSAILEKIQRFAIDIEKELEKENLISCSKETFWTTLVEVGALINVEDIIVMDDSECDVETKLDRSENVLTIDGYVQYEPKYFSQTDLQKKKKIMFPKNYVIDTLPTEKYRQRKPKFEFNKIGKINFEKLKAVDLKALGQLTKDHLRHTDFNPNERQIIWNELKAQRIIDDQGYYIPLAPDFKYSDCPIYEVTVNWLIMKTFPAEFVRRKWLEMESKNKASGECLDCVNSINLLPEKPYRQMLGELIASHVISVARVADDIQFDVEFDVESDVKQKLKEITDNKEERDYIKELLKERQADYVATKTENVTLEYIEGKIEAIEDMRNMWTELHVFRLIGFDCIISIKDRGKSWKTNAKAIGIIVLGGVQYIMGVGGNLIPLGIANSLIGDFTKTGLDDIYFGIQAFHSPNDLMFHYRRQKIKSLKESGGLLLRGGTSLAQQIHKKIEEKKSQS